MKVFYSCVDPKVIAPQSEQHYWISNFAESLGGKIVFYGAEDFFVAGTQPFILPKLKRTPNLDGVIFFTLDQFCYNDKFNNVLLKNILNINLSINFAREKFSINNFNDFSQKYLELIAYFHSKKNGYVIKE